MFEIKGKVTTAICYAKVVEDEAIEQIKRMCDYDLTRGSKVRIMPDVHAGKGCTIGTTMTITDKICPNIVGVDIGCGMYTVKLQDQKINFEKIDEACHYIPSGMNVWEGRMERFDLTQLKENESWDICDYRYWGEPIWRKEFCLNLRDYPELWQKCYRRK